ncbi:MAG: transcriptional repressor [Chloroflexi bacterium]|nr:transcriptional repressor [Chloroflexota bacterium]
MRLSINSAIGSRTSLLLQKLTQAGRRSTEARHAVLTALARKPDGFTVQQLCRDLPSVGRATVYRTIRLLVHHGLVCKLALRDTTPRYSLALPGHHHHAVCIQCGAIANFDQCQIDDLIARIKAASEGEVLGHRLEVYVLCKTCRLSQRNDSLQDRQHST